MTATTLTGLVEARLDLMAEKEKIELRIADVDAELEPLLAAHGGRFELPYAEGQGFRLQTSSRFDAGKLRELAGDVAFTAASIFPPRSKADAAKVFPGSLVDQCMVAGTPSIRKIAERRRG